MAVDIQDEDSEEQKKQNTGSQDDDDFGLPDLEFEELEELDLDLEDEKNESDEDNSEDIALSEEDLTIDKDDPDQDEIDKESTESLFASDSNETNDDLFGGSGDFEGGSIFESDDIVLKEQEKEAFEPAEDSELPPSYKPYSDEESKGGFAKIIIFGAIGFALIGFVFYFVFKQGGDSTQSGKKAETIAKIEKPKTETKSSEEESKGLGEATEIKEEKPVEPKNDAKTVAKTTKKSPPAAKPITKASKPASSAPAGEIVNIQEKTGRTYIIIGSFIDQDLANDYAKELASAGNGSKIIFPYNNSKRYRVSIADFDSFSDAAAQLNSYKSTYGDGAWALKY